MANRSAGSSTTQITSALRCGSAHSGQGSLSVNAKHTEQRRVSSFTAISASASAWAYSRSPRRMWNASREAVFSPIPGSRVSCWIRRVIEGGCAMRRSPETGDRQPPRHLLHLLGDERSRRAKRVVHGGHHEILEHLAVGRLEEGGVDLDAQDLEAAVHQGGHHPAAGAALDGAGGDLVLHRCQPLLELLRLLKQATQVEPLAHAPSSVRNRRSRTPRTSAPKISTAACTRGSASVSCSRRRACVIGVSPAWSRGTGPTSTRSGRSASSLASAPSRASVSLPATSSRSAALSIPRSSTPSATRSGRAVARAM